MRTRFLRIPSLPRSAAPRATGNAQSKTPFCFVGVRTREDWDPGASGPFYATPPRAPFLGTGVAVGLSSVRLFLRFPATGWSGSRTLSRELRAHMCAFPRTVARPHSQEGALSPSEAALRGSLAAAPQTPLRVLTLTFPQSPD